MVEVHDAQRLKELQALPLDRKIGVTSARIIEWYNHFKGRVYVSYSGGADSTVLLHLVRSVFPDVLAVFVDTGLEYPELRDHVKQTDNVLWIKPEMNYKDVIKQYGWTFPNKEIARKIYYARQGSQWAINVMYGLNTDGSVSKYAQRCVKWNDLINSPFLISDRCCDIMKERPLRTHPLLKNQYSYVGTRAEESERRRQAWIQTGCNAFNTRNPVSKPLSFWTHQDVLQYIVAAKLTIPSVYGQIVSENQTLKFTGVQRTGCIFCPIGAHLERENSFQQLAYTHPKLYHYCLYGGEYNENGMWVPNSQGLGLSKLLDFVGIPYQPIAITNPDGDLYKAENDLRERARQYLAITKISKQQFASEIGINNQQLSRWLHNKRNLNAQRLERVEALLNQTE